jgi:hypothetical protein
METHLTDTAIDHAKMMRRKALMAHLERIAFTASHGDWNPEAVVDFVLEQRANSALTAVQECYKTIDVASDEILKTQAGPAAVAAHMLAVLKSIEARMREGTDV